MNEQNNKKNRQRGRNKRIGFSQEVVTKDVAKNLLSSQKKNDGKSESENFMAKLTNTISQNVQSKVKRKKDKNKGENGIMHNENAQPVNSEESPKKKRKKQKKELENSIQNNEEQTDLNTEELNTKKKKRKKNIENDLVDNDSGELKPKKKKKNKNTENESIETQENGDSANEESTSNKQSSSETMSKRAMKKIKHQKLVDEKKVKIDIALQQKALNYLSKWKHDRANWKFEKLRQIWLLQNLYDSTKIEDKFWDTTLEYFNSSKGKVHKTILDEAIKIVENEVQPTDESSKVKLKRARDIVQNLQE